MKHPSNPLALAVLALVFERPMHPYEMASVMKQRHKHNSIKLRYGSLYTVIDLLVQRGLIEAKETKREGARPERTVYRITPPGRAELMAWMRDLVVRWRRILGRCASENRQSQSPGDRCARRQSACSAHPRRP